jgi:hypothetical protein
MCLLDETKMASRIGKPLIFWWAVQGSNLRPLD